MTIKCRTGCDVQINYEEHVFPDGFIYFLPKNKNGTIHKCKKFPESPTLEILHNYDKISDKTDDNYLDEYAKVDGIWLESYEEQMYTLSHSQFSAKKNQEQNLLWRYELRKLQTLLVLFPTPFEDGFIDSISPNPQINYEDGYPSLLIHLSMLYEYLDDFESAEKARLIQDKITHDQAEKIVNLMKKQKNIDETFNEKILKINISVQELRSKYFRKVENRIKYFIRKKYVNDNLKKDFPELYQNANQLRENYSKDIEHANDDVIEYLSFGACVKILKNNRNDVNKKGAWKAITHNIINYAFYVVDRRNDIDHYSDDKLEVSATNLMINNFDEMYHQVIASCKGSEKICLLSDKPKD